METRMQQMSPSNFFYNNRDMAGFGNATRSIYTAVRELFENALDACDGNGTPADITMTIKEHGKQKNNSNAKSLEKHYTITVTDNGPGIPSKIIPEAFGKVMYGSKFGLRQARGMFGMGATMAILYGQITSNMPVVVESSTGKEWHKYVLRLDIKNNIPQILQKSVQKRAGTGLSISVTLLGNYSRAAKYIRDYIKQSALITPYASIKYQGPGDGEEDTININRVTNTVPKPPEYAKPHPHGSDVESLGRMISNTLKLPSKITAEDLNIAKIKGEDTKKYPRKFKSSHARLIGALALTMDLPASKLIGCIPHELDVIGGGLEWTTSDGKWMRSRVNKELCKMVANDGEVISKFLTRFQGIGPGIAKTFLKDSGFNSKTSVLAMQPNDLDGLTNVKQRDILKITELAEALNSYEGFRAPDPSCLAPLGANFLEAGMKSIFNPEFVETLARQPKSYSGSPFIVEAGIAYGGEITSSHGGPNLIRFANRIPLLFDEGSDTAFLIVKEIDWKRYGMRDDAPIVICTHICSTKIPYKSAGKENVSSRPEIDKELKLALQELGRKIGIHVRRKMDAERAAQRDATIKKYLAGTIKYICEMSGKKEIEVDSIS